MRLHDFDALTFDCYGTLIDWERGILNALRPWLQQQGAEIDDERLLTIYSASEPKHEAQSPTSPYPEILKAVITEIAAKLDLEVTDQERETFSRSVRDWPAFPDSAENVENI